VTRSIGGTITPVGLGALLGDRPDMADQHRDPTAWALRDATDHTRRALAALRSLDAGLMPGDAWAAVSRAAAVLRDVTDDLDRIVRRQPATSHDERWGGGITR